MESSIAVFLLRQSACELLPTILHLQQMQGSQSEGARAAYAVQARVGGSSAQNEGRTTTTSHLSSAFVRWLSLSKSWPRLAREAEACLRGSGLPKSEACPRRLSFMFG